MLQKCLTLQSSEISDLILLNRKAADSFRQSNSVIQRFFKEVAYVCGLFFCCLLVPFAAVAQPDDRIEIFDAHLHYNWEPRPLLTLEQVLKLFRDNKVTGILATSRPNDGTHALMESLAPDLQIVPFIRPYRVRSDISSWFTDSTIFDLVSEEFKRGYYRGLGEFHLSGRAPASEGVRKAVNFAVEHDLFLHAHGDDEMVEIMMGHNPKAKIIWAHTGFALPTERVAQLLEKYPNLWGELSYRSGIVTGDGKLSDEWRALFTRYPDRFLIGSDTWINERWTAYSAIMTQYRAWLVQLPRETANRIAHGNARMLFGANTKR
jgi:Amidohydrolase